MGNPLGSLEKYLSQNKQIILERWQELIWGTYPAETARFLQKNNQFENPVGHDIREGIQGIFDGILQCQDKKVFYPFLDKIVRIRAVQSFSPSQAVAVVFFLKQAVREELRKEIAAHKIPYGELLTFESKVDEMALLTFDVYMECREKLSEIRINEVKNRTYKLLQKANLIV